MHDTLNPSRPRGGSKSLLLAVILFTFLAVVVMHISGLQDNPAKDRKDADSRVMLQIGSLFLWAFLLFMILLCVFKLVEISDKY